MLTEGTAWHSRAEYCCQSTQPKKQRISLQALLGICISGFPHGQISEMPISRPLARPWSNGEGTSNRFALDFSTPGDPSLPILKDRLGGNLVLKGLGCTEMGVYSQLPKGQEFNPGLPMSELRVAGKFFGLG
jgi:hypothetical protein